jgi:hypothetical protein
MNKVKDFFYLMTEEEKSVMLYLFETEKSSNDFDKKVLKLLGNQWRLSNEDEKIILEITEKMPLRKI